MIALDVGTQQHRAIRRYVTGHSGQLSLSPGQEMSEYRANERWQCSAAGKVTVGLASYHASQTLVRPSTDLVGYEHPADTALHQCEKVV